MIENGRQAGCWSMLAALVLTIAATVEVEAGTVHEVELLHASFSPAHLIIDTGDTVRWVWVMEFHDVISGDNGVHDGNFHSGRPTGVPGTTFEVTFDQDFLDRNPMPLNHYPYFCSIHIGFGMTGSITVKPIGPECPGDLNGDGIVDVFDLLSLLSDWGNCDDPDDCPGDLNNSGGVDVFDLLILLSNWGACPES